MTFVSPPVRHRLGDGVRDLMLRFGAPLTGNLGALFELAASRHPDQSLISDRQSDLSMQWPTDATAADWAAHAEEASGWLAEAGVRAGDRVTIMKANHPDILILSAAACRIGAVPVQLSSTLEHEAVVTLLERLERPFLVTDTERIESCGLDGDSLRRLCAATIVVDGEQPGCVSLDSLRNAAIPASRPRADDELMIMTHTSGTTGVPKLVMHSAETIRLLALPELQPWPYLGVQRTDTVAICDPFFHARLVTALIAGATKGCKGVFISEPRIEHVAPLLVEHRPTMFEAIPNAHLYLEGLADDPREPLRSVRLFGNCFDAIHARTVRKFLAASHRRFPFWIQTWGQSEAGMIAAALYTRRSVRSRGRRRPKTQRVGWSLPVVSRVRAVDAATGHRVPRGRPGLIEVQQPGRCLGYWGEMDRWQAKTTDGWWNSGDLAVITRKGSIWLVDREVDQIPGESGIELEDVLLDRLPNATEVVVLAIPGARPLPVLSTRDDEPLNPSDWQTAIADLPALDDPVQLRWEEIPRTATWKIQRNRLRERLRPGSGPIGTGRWT